MRPLPYADPDRLVAIWSTERGSQTKLSYPDYVDFREQNQAFENTAAYSTTRSLAEMIVRSPSASAYAPKR